MSNGEIIVFDSSTNPGKVCRVLEPSSTIDFCKVTCCSSFSNPCVIIGGTDAGQIVAISPETGQATVLAQGHIADVVSVKCHPTEPIIFSAGNDKIVRTWRFSSTKLQVEPLYTSATVGFPCRCVPSSLNDPTFMLFSNNGVLSVQDSKTTKTHSQNDEHTKLVTSLAHLPTLGIYATGGMDGLVKIWTSENVLIREIQTGEPVTCVAFGNNFGDLLIGMHDEVSLIAWNNCTI
jgi:WD40 repeat protein